MVGMNATGPSETTPAAPRQAVWAVVRSDIGPLLLAATDAGLVNVVFHATDAVRDKALDRLGSRLGTEPVEAPESPCSPRRYGSSRSTSPAVGASSMCRSTGH